MWLDKPQLVLSPDVSLKFFNYPFNILVIFQNSNFKNRILLALTKSQIKHLNFVHINQMSSDILMLIFLPEK